METITYLLGAIVVINALRLWITLRPMTKKRHFKLKRDGVQKMIDDLEFKVFKLKELREEVREEYDFMNSRIDNFEKQIADFKGKKEDKANIEDDLERAEKDRDRLKGQIQELDWEIEGAKPSAEMPNGVIGIYENIDSLRELKALLTSWIKKI